MGSRRVFRKTSTELMLSAAQPSVWLDRLLTRALARWRRPCAFRAGDRVEWIDAPIPAGPAFPGLSQGDRLRVVEVSPDRLGWRLIVGDVPGWSADDRFGADADNFRSVG